MNSKLETASLLIAAGVTANRLPAAQEEWRAIQDRGDATWPRFFSPAEFRLLKEIGAIVYAGDWGYGALAAAFVDLAAANSDKEVQAAWREQIEAFQELCRNWFGGDFTNLSLAQKQEAVGIAASEEHAPRSLAGQFFARLKHIADGARSRSNAPPQDIEPGREPAPERKRPNSTFQPAAMKAGGI